MEPPDFSNDLFSQNKISMKDIDNYLNQNQMNFNFNDNLFGGIEDDDIEKEIMGLKVKRPGPPNDNKKATDGESPEPKMSDDDAMHLAEFDKVLEKYNININDLIMDKNDELLNKIMMEASQGK